MTEYQLKLDSRSLVITFRFEVLQFNQSFRYSKVTNKVKQDLFVYIASEISLYKTVQNKTYEVISKHLFKNSLLFQVTRKYCVCNVNCSFLLADKHWHLLKGFSSGVN